MTTGGWINLVLSVGFVTALFLWCVGKVLFGKQAKIDHQLAHVEPVERDETDKR